MLKERGLNIADEQAAEKTLNTISYFRLAAYLRPMEADKGLHKQFCHKDQEGHSTRLRHDCIQGF